MIGPLRARHRWLAPGAFGLAVAGLAIGVAARPTAFVRERRALDEPPPVPPAVEARAVPALDAPGLAVAFDAALDPPLWLVARERIAAPDVLAYHTAMASWDGALPGDARLVGEVAPEGASPLVAPSALEGRLVLFSLGHRSALGTIDLGALAGEKEKD